MPNNQELRARTLADLATDSPLASRVFRAHRLDFCCGGNISLAEACAQKNLDVSAIEAELSRPALQTDERTSDFTTPELIAHIVENYHDPLRQEFSDLFAMAKRVEFRHGDKADCPHGLAAHLQQWAVQLMAHMEREEELVFPLLIQGKEDPEALLRELMDEHDSHGADIEKTRKLVSDYVPPAGACNTWRALYLRLDELEAQLMAHVHLENAVLFRRILDTQTSN